jgi:hypothetical protein
VDTRAQKALEHLVRETYAYLPAEIAIFGTGDLGRAVAARVADAGGRVMFTTSDADSWGSAVDGIPVLPPAEAVSRAAAVAIASVAHAALLAEQVRRLCESVVILCWADGDELLTVDLSPRHASRRWLERCLSLLRLEEAAVVVLPDLTAVTTNVRAQWSAVTFTTANRAAAIDIDGAEQSPWIIGDTSPEGSCLAVALTERGWDVRSPVAAAAHRTIDAWHRSTTARIGALA